MVVVFSRDEMLMVVRRHIADHFGLNQSRFADYLGVSTAFVSKVVGGKCPPGDRVLRAVGLRAKTVYVCEESE